MSDRPARILFLNHVSRMSGAEASLLDLTQALNANRFTLTVALPGPGPLAEALASRDIRTCFLPFRRLRRSLNPLLAGETAWSMVRVAAGLRALCRRERIDILHANSDTAFLYAALCPTPPGVRKVWHSRDLAELGRGGRWLYARADRVIAISEAVRRHLRRYATDESKLVTIHNGIDVAHFVPQGGRAATRTALGLAAGTFLIGMAGQLVPGKRHDLFLDMAQRLGVALPDARFLVIGGDLFGDQPAYAREIERRVRTPELDGKVLLIGPRADVRPLYEALDVLVHPASREPFGRVVAEAMAMGKPVVAVNACGPAEIIRDGADGLLVPADSADALAAAVLRLAQDGALARRLGVAAAARVRDAFSLGLLGERVERLYAELLANVQH